MTIKIKREGNYYYGTLNAVPDGDVTDPYGEVLTYPDVESAHRDLTDQQQGWGLEHDGGGVYSAGGVYVCSHGQHSRPRYTLVNAASGRSNAEIRRQADSMSQ